MCVRDAALKGPFKESSRCKKDELFKKQGVSYEQHKFVIKNASNLAMQDFKKGWNGIIEISNISTQNEKSLRENSNKADALKTHVKLSTLSYVTCQDKRNS